MAINKGKNNSSYPWAKDVGHLSTEIDTSSSKLSAIFINEVNKEDKGFPGGSDGKESACNTGELGSIPGLGRCPGEVQGNPLQYSCLENPMDRGVWQATVDGVTASDTTERISTAQGRQSKLNVYSLKQKLYLAIHNKDRRPWKKIQKHLKSY